MTYSLIEKEETIYEQQIDELFNLTEFDIATSPKQGIGSGKQYEYRDQDGKLWTGNSEFLNKIAHGDSTGHHMDIYKNTPSPKNIFGTGVTDPIDTIEINPGDADTDDEGGETDIPKLIPPYVVPTKPKPVIGKKQKLISLTKPKPVVKKPIAKPPQLRPPPVKKLLPAPKPPQLRLPKPELSPLSPRNQKAAQIAQEEIDRIIKRLQNNKTTLKQGTKLLVQLKKLEQYKPLRLNIPKAQIPKRFFSLPAPTDSKVTVPKLGVPEPLKGTKLGVPDPLKGTKLGVPDPLKGTKLTVPKLSSTGLPTVPKLSSTGLPTAPGVSPTEKQRLAKIASDAVKKVKTVDTSTAHLVGDDGNPIDDKKTKTQVEVDPSAKSDMAKGMVQPKEGQGIKSFAKQLGYNTVEEFEKANPKGVGIDKKTGNKFVKTGVSYIDKAEVNRLNSITLGKAGKANELKIAKKKLVQAKRNGKTTLANTLEKHVASLEADIKGTKGKSPTVIDRKNVMAKKGLRPKWNLGRTVDIAKVRGKLAVGLGKRVAGHAAAYAVPILNVVVIAYDIHELMVTKTGDAGTSITTQSGYRQNDLRRMDAIVNSEASIEQKREALEGLGTNKGIFNDIQGNRKWEKETHNWEEHQIDPIMPFVDDNENAFDPFKMSLTDMKKYIPQQVASGPYTQRDIEYIIQRTIAKKEYDLQISPHQVRDKTTYLKNYKEKLSLLKSIKKTIPETNRVDAYKKVFAMAIDVQEAHVQAGGTLAFKHSNTKINDKPDAGITTDYQSNRLARAKKEYEENNAIANAVSFTNAEIGDDRVARWEKNKRAREKSEEEPGFWQQGYDTIAGYFTGDDKGGTATAGMGTRPSQNNDPEVVTTVGTPYGNDPGAPANFREYETLMKQVSLGFDLPIAVVRALAMQESGMHVTNKGQLSPWSYTGDHTLGKKGAFGPFHVRSDPDKGASLEHFNEVKSTTYTWKDLATNPMLAAAVGATYFKHWYDKTGGDAQKAYELYNGGPSGYMKTQSIANAKKFKERLDKFNESRNFANKSAILEGMALAT